VNGNLHRSMLGKYQRFPKIPQNSNRRNFGEPPQSIRRLLRFPSTSPIEDCFTLIERSRKTARDDPGRGGSPFSPIYEIRFPRAKSARRS